MMVATSRLAFHSLSLQQWMIDLHSREKKMVSAMELGALHLMTS